MDPMQPMQQMPERRNSLALPFAIIFGFGMIAVAIFVTNQNNGSTTPAEVTQNESDQVEEGELPPVTDSDYILGNPNAPILIIEYADYECPFCKQYHATMHQIMDEYGVSGKVAWVYRQFPLAQLHPNAPRISEAALCVGDVAGNEAFWDFSDLVFEEREMDEATNVTRLPDYAEEVGVNRDQYTSCMNSERMQDRVMTSAEEAFAMGARGTPYTVVTVGDQEAVINGAQPYDVVDGVVSNLIDQLEGRAPADNNQSTSQ